MNQNTVAAGEAEFDPARERTTLVNALAEAARAALEFDFMSAVVLGAIPGTEPQQYVIAGTPAGISKMRKYLDRTADAASSPVSEAQTEQWRPFVDQAIDVLQRHISPDGLSDKDALSELYGIFDGPEFRKMGTVPQIQCDARQAQAIGAAKEIDKLSTVGATPQHSVAEQASIDSDPEFQRLAEYWRSEPYGTRSFENAWGELVAHIDSRVQSLASTAATQPEQATIKTWQERLFEVQPDARTYIAHVQHELGASHKDAEIADLRAALGIPASTSAPVDMILHCPACRAQHIDAPDDRTPDWKNEPHRSHLCHDCGHIWRPADVPTNGVKAITTQGKNDSPAASTAASEPIGQVRTDLERANVVWFGQLPPHGTNLYTAAASEQQAGPKQGNAHRLMLAAGFACDYDKRRGVHTYTGFIEDAERLLEGAAGEQQAGADERALTDEQIIEALHGQGIDTYPSKYGFDAAQVSATSVPNLRKVIEKCAAVTHRATTATSKDVQTTSKTAADQQDAAQAQAGDTRHPIQPLIVDPYGRIRFKRNAIVDHLTRGKLNDLAVMDFPQEDWEQLAQLIGYSLSGFGELSYVTDGTYDRAAQAAPATSGGENG